MNNLDAWKEFSKQIETHVKLKAMAYEQENGLDLLSSTGERICQWNILKYAMRVWNNRKKDRDYFKIAHYAQVAWQKSKNRNYGESEK